MTPPLTIIACLPGSLPALKTSRATGGQAAPVLRRTLLSLLLFGAMPMASHAKPLGERASTTALGVTVTVIDPCMNSLNAARPECAARLNSRIRESIEPATVRNTDGSVREDMTPGLYTVRVVDYY